MHGQWLRTSVLLALMLYSIPKLRSTHRNLDLTEMDFLPYGKMLLIKEMELPYKETVIHLINLSWASLVGPAISAYSAVRYVPDSRLRSPVGHLISTCQLLDQHLKAA